MFSKMKSARFIKNGVEKKINLFELTEKEYQEKYRGYLFCPNANCNARVIFAYSDLMKKHFRTYPVRTKEGTIISQHITGCEYSVEHKLTEQERRRKDPEYKIAISSQHMRDKLKSVHNDLVNPRKSKKETLGTAPKRPSSKSKVISERPSGVAGIMSNGAVEGTGRAPSVYHRSVNALGDRDYFYTRAVDGHIDEMVLGEDYIYINLRRNDQKKARVLFSEAFKVNSPGVDVSLYRNYIDICQKKRSALLVCIGDVRKDDYEISIVIDSWEALMIDGKRYYEMVNELQIS
jgi:hypothetical protein